MLCVTNCVIALAFWQFPTLNSKGVNFCQELQETDAVPEPLLRGQNIQRYANAVRSLDSVLGQLLDLNNAVGAT